MVKYIERTKEYERNLEDSEQYIDEIAKAYITGHEAMHTGYKKHIEIEEKEVPVLIENSFGVYKIYALVYRKE